MLEGLFQIIPEAVEGSRRTYTVRINPSHQVFKGHFPDQPVLPGVAMVYLSRLLTQTQLGDRKLKEKGIPQIKFLSLVDPGTHAEFTYTNDIVKEENGTIQVKGEMVNEGLVFFKITANYN